MAVSLCEVSKTTMIVITSHPRRWYRSKPKSPGIREGRKKVLQRLSSQTGRLNESVKRFCPPGNRWVRANIWISKSKYARRKSPLCCAAFCVAASVKWAYLWLQSAASLMFSVSLQWWTLQMSPTAKQTTRTNSISSLFSSESFDAVILLLLLFTGSTLGFFFFCFFFSDTIGQK